jgi:hypothetical protein
MFSSSVASTINLRIKQIAIALRQAFKQCSTTDQGNPVAHLCVQLDKDDNVVLDKGTPNFNGIDGKPSLYQVRSWNNIQRDGAKDKFHNTNPAAEDPESAESLFTVTEMPHWF